MLYGQRGQGSGRMPGFGDNPDDADDLDDDEPGDGMFTDEMICSVAKYEASLGADVGADHRGLRPDPRSRSRRPPPPSRHRRHGRRGGRGVSAVHLARRHRLGPADPRLPRGPRRRRRADGLRVPAARHEPRRPPRLPRGDQRDLRLVHDHGHHLVGLRQHRDARRGTALGGRGDRVPARRHRRGRARPGRPREGPRARHQPRSRRPRSSRSSTRTRSPSSQEEVADALGAWEILAEANPAFGEAKATVDEHFVATPLEALGLEGAADYVTVYSFETGGKDDLPDDPSRLDRITTQAEDHLPGSSSTPPATPSSRCSR